MSDRSYRKLQNESAIAERLIDAAEKLYAEHGIDGVSLRQISQTAGTANNYAVQYHFDNQLGLIRAISKKRMPEIEAHRAKLLMEAKANGQLDDIRTLLEIIHRPLVEHSNAQGEKLYARFILATLHAPVSRNISTTDLLQTMPVALHVIELVAELLNEMPPEIIAERQRMVLLIMLNSLFSRFSQEGSSLTERAILNNALDMSAAAMQAPITQAT